MRLSEEKRNEMVEAAKPLLKWLNDNCHPHCTIIVETTKVELLEGVASHLTNEFVKN